MYKENKEHYDPFDAESQKATQAQALTAKLAIEEEESDIKWLMSNRRGRRVVWRLLDQAGVFRSSFSTVAMQMSFNEGNRNYGLRMLDLVHRVCPELYPQMMKEQKDVRTDRPIQ